MNYKPDIQPHELLEIEDLGYEIVIRRSNKKHGMLGTPEYNAWQNMKNRCLNPKYREYEYYGERGITVCDRWLYSFENFYTDVGNRPTPLHSLDRINPNGNYEPSNIRWATKTLQSTNQRLRKDNKSGYKGVQWAEDRHQWRVYLKLNNKKVYLGQYEDIDTAIKARKAGEEQYGYNIA